MNNPCMKMGNPFYLFPEEIWEMVLDQLTDSQDACNLFIALPQLGINSTYLRKKKHVWLFGMIIPHLIKWIRYNWISEGDLLNCRLVSKRWSAAVDNFLENQPQLRDYNPETQVPRQFPWNTRTYLELPFHRKINMYLKLNVKRRQTFIKVYEGGFCIGYMRCGMIRYEKRRLHFKTQHN